MNVQNVSHNMNIHEQGIGLVLHTFTVNWHSHFLLQLM